MNKKKLIEQIKSAMQELPKTIPLVFQKGHLPVGSDPDKHAEAGMTETQRAALREREAKARRQAKPGKEPENASQVQPEAKQEPEESGWWYEHSSEYDQNGCRMSETSNDVYQQMRDRLAQDFSRHMRNQQRPY